MIILPWFDDLTTELVVKDGHSSLEDLRVMLLNGKEKREVQIKIIFKAKDRCFRVIIGVKNHGSL